MDRTNHTYGSFKDILADADFNGEDLDHDLLKPVSCILIFFYLRLTCLHKSHLSYDVTSGSEITPCNKIDKPLVVYRFTGNVMTSITTLRT